jgi:DNA-binding NtrC family response regulator
LIEAELFGHERGAFSGADRARAGFIESAAGGTVLLDEVGELPLPVQAKLLRVLEDHQITRVGASSSRRVDVRFLAATNRDVEGEVAAGRFRRDLYFRLSGVVLEIPPLRARPAEIVPLAETFAREAAERQGRRPPRLAEATAAVLRAHSWPGNVRELRNVIERALLLADGDTIEPAHLPAALSTARPALDGTLSADLAELERRRIVEALERCGGNQTRAAALLGMPRRTLVKRLSEYGIRRKNLS